MPIWNCRTGIFKRFVTPGLTERISKTYAEAAAEVIREDLEFRKLQHNPAFNKEKTADMMDISRSQPAKAPGEDTSTKETSMS